MEQKDIKNTLIVNEAKIKKARYLLVILLIMEILVSILKLKLSIFYFYGEMICLIILIPIIYNMQYNDCVLHAVLILFNFLIMVNYFIQTLIKSSRFLSLNSPQILISYISFGFYTIDLVFIFSVYRILKSNSYYQLLYCSLQNNNQVRNNNSNNIKNIDQIKASTEKKENIIQQSVEQFQLINKSQQQQSNTNKQLGLFSNLKI
ncbi:transmembrane protein, putative (macronuclear) [Tetrahymena thermophila SB210]|uniref:Transmembrane protein, putative n=1 Tax=Tetrahymena thermophila (strain SB210) TaxID=312017 RepID=A4VF38_TETTS|nr:transmembrane protein, putative [Tetrahymena thermophila SB210]EDK31216.1 transmembrane protein, putative [Tetrahymena thermophila SB210]|eukprot:XP_001470655.1 transmembrane protein, putative [Tetrahymena thermophila SB210]